LLSAICHNGVDSSWMSNLRVTQQRKYGNHCFMVNLKEKSNGQEEEGSKEEDREENQEEGCEEESQEESQEEGQEESQEEKIS